MINMRTVYKHILYAGIIALSIAGFSSCDEDETYDFPGDPYNRVYMQDKSTGYKIVQTPISTLSNVDFKTSLKCTQKASEDIKATVEIDNSLIEAYNAENGTNYEAMPTSAILIENATMTIPAGGMAAVDTLRLTLTNDETELGSLNSENGYIIPLSIGTTMGGDSQASSNIYTNYLIVTVTEDNVNHEAVESDITGALVVDQTNWTASTNGSISSWNSPIDAIFDGAMSTYFYISSSSEDLHLDINMGKAYTFNAITFYYGYDYGSWGRYEYDGLLEGMTIYISSDGLKWDSVGEVSSPSKFCVFYAPITTQYIRIVSPVSTYGATMSGGIFNIYEK